MLLVIGGVLFGFGLTVAASLIGSGLFGHLFATAAACQAPVGTLLDTPWCAFGSVAVFALTLWIMHGLII